MDVEMQTTVVIVWLAGVVCGTGFFVGLGAFFWNWRKKYKERLIYCLIAALFGFIGMSNSIFSLLRLIRSWVES